MSASGSGEKAAAEERCYASADAIAQNPESGTITYTYDPNGNLSTRTEGRGITTTLNFDGQNRLSSRTYSDTTPAVTNTWDTGAGCLKGYLCSVASGSTTRTYSYNVLGQVTSGAQVTNSVSYPFSYSYDLPRCSCARYDGTGDPAGATRCGLALSGD